MSDKTLEQEQLEKLIYRSDDNINDLIYAESYVKIKNRMSEKLEVKYFCPQKFYPIKYIILSATLNKNIYEKYFQSLINVYLYPEKKAAYQGKLIQYTYHSLGRRDLAEKMEVFSYVSKIAKNEELEIITFKLVNGNENRDTTCMHFGNTTGINSLAGKDIGIIGTPYKVEETYKLIACYLGASVNTKDDKAPRIRRIDYKNYNFLMVTYKEPLLREVQLYSIESELEQCVGRARLLRKDCSVYLFSAFPCEQAELHTKNYLLT